MPFRIPMLMIQSRPCWTIQYKGDCYVPTFCFSARKNVTTRFQPDPTNVADSVLHIDANFLNYGIVATQESYPTGKAGASYYLTTLSKATYNVTLYPNGGAIAAGQDVTSYTYGSGATLPTDVTRSGYTFAGWYDNEALEGTPVTSISATDTGNKEYWAKWTQDAPPYALPAPVAPSQIIFTPNEEALPSGSLELKQGGRRSGAGDHRQLRRLRRRRGGGHRCPRLRSRAHPVRDHRSGGQAHRLSVRPGSPGGIRCR